MPKNCSPTLQKCRLWPLRTAKPHVQPSCLVCRQRESFIRSKYESRTWRGAPTAASIAKAKTRLSVPLSDDETHAALSISAPAEAAGGDSSPSMNPAVARRLARLGLTPTAGGTPQADATSSAASSPTSNAGRPEASNGFDLLSPGGSSSPPPAANAGGGASGFSFVTSASSAGNSQGQATAAGGFTFTAAPPSPLSKSSSAPPQPAKAPSPGGNDLEDLFGGVPSTASAAAEALHSTRRRSASGDLLGGIMGGTPPSKANATAPAQPAAGGGVVQQIVKAVQQSGAIKASMSAEAVHKAMAEAAEQLIAQKASQPAAGGASVSGFSFM